MLTIDKDALLAKITKYGEPEVWGADEYAQGLLDQYRMDVATIKAAPVVNNWINVKDRLPEEGKYVLVWESQGFAYCEKLICGIWNIGANNGAIITHWMPLPEPPKEDGTCAR